MTMREGVVEVFDCRERLTPLDKVRLGAMVVKENGLAWTAWWGAYYLTTAVANKASQKMHDIRAKHGVPGINGVAVNRYVWNAWRWDTGGEEWTASPEWMASLTKRVIDRYVKEGTDILEIGLGAGRWTKVLAPRAARLHGLDISSTCLDLCRERFRDATNLTFHLGSGSDCAGIADASIDAVVSMDSFVHINSPEVRGYAREFARVMRPGAVGIIQHGSCAGRSGGCRSDITAESFSRILGDNGLEIVEQIRAWDDPGGESFDVSIYGDVVTVFRKPRRKRAKNESATA